MVYSKKVDFAAKFQTGFLHLLGIGTALFCNAIFLNFNVFRGFNFFDMGSFLDASWRVYKWQTPYVDFIYISGPVHLYMNAFFFFIFGFGKMAVLAHLLTVSSVIIVVTYFIARKGTNVFFASLIALLSGACFYWPISHPWYDQSAHLWGILAVALIVDQLPIQKSKHKTRYAILSGILTALSFLAKSNIGFAYGIVFVVLFCNARDFRSLPVFIITAVLSTITILIWVAPIPLYFDQAFLQNGVAVQNVSFQTRRITYLLTPINWFRGFYWTLGAVIIWSCGQFIKKLPQEFILFFGVLFVALFSMLTGSMLHESNIPLLGLSCALGVRLNQKVKLLFRRNPNFSEVKYRRTILVFFVLVIAFLIQSTVYGFELRPWTYAGNPIGDYAVKSTPFTGWMCQHEDGEDLDNMVNFIKENIPQNQSLLVLTDMQILYSLTGRDSYRGVPFNFFEKAAPAPGRQLEQVRWNILSHPPDWIITHRFQRSFVTFLVHYLKLRDFIIEHYEPVKKWNNYAILKWKK